MSEPSNAEGSAPVVLTEVKDGVLCITLNRPDRLNASTPEMVRMYMEALLAGADDSDVRVIVVTGAGRGFCSGLEASQLDGMAAGTPRAAMLRRHWVTTQIPKPVIAAINGACVGAGFAIAMMCDMRIAAQTAKFGPGFARLGLPAEHGSEWMLSRIVGYARAFEILASGRLYVGDELLRLGLVNQVVADGEALPCALQLAQEMASQCSPRSLAMIKTQLHRSLNTDLAEADRVANQLMDISVAAPDFSEALLSRKEKRPAQFQALGNRESWWISDETKLGE